MTDVAQAVVLVAPADTRSAAGANLLTDGGCTAQ
jgi:hypothetical protein